MSRQISKWPNIPSNANQTMIFSWFQNWVILELPLCFQIQKQKQKSVCVWSINIGLTSPGQFHTMLQFFCPSIICLGIFSFVLEINSWQIYSRICQEGLFVALDLTRQKELICLLSALKTIHESSEWCTSVAMLRIQVGPTLTEWVLWKWARLLPNQYAQVEQHIKVPVMDLGNLSLNPRVASILALTDSLRAQS